ncbi:MAG: carboxy-S-adenosyl-L-methionine synthase CmoA [Woeseiaceae bacterium]|nr:carboxy-S-adenosyl-L-methionine synthase CmoA [Woeseiaceae bacterium]
MTRDKLYADGKPPEGPFEFSDAVADVFPDMLRRSIPGYAATIQAIRSLTRTHARGGTRLYDLGCSLGAATRAMRQGLSVPGCRIVAVDNAPAMVRRCRQILASDDDPTPVEVLSADVREVVIENASVVVMNYTLQFLPPGDRKPMVDAVAKGLNPGGVFVLSEKVVHADPAVEAALTELHLEFKRRHDYSELEISRKRAALEKVLVPDTVETHLSRLGEAGFSHAGVWLRYFNFVSLLAIR